MVQYTGLKHTVTTLDKQRDIVMGGVTNGGVDFSCI